MTVASKSSRKQEAELSLFQLLKPEVIADPYPLYRRLREFEPVHWDPFLHSWVVTSYAECVTVLSKHKAARTPTPETLESLGLSVLAVHADMMLKQILFLDGAAHAKLRSLCMAAFSPRRMEAFRGQMVDVANELLDKITPAGTVDLISDFVRPYPAILLAKLMGLPLEDADRLKVWSSDVSELLGNFEHNLDRVKQLVTSMEEVRDYLISMMTERRGDLEDGVILALLDAEVDGQRLSVDEIVANVLLIIAGGLEEPGNLIGCGMYTLTRWPDQWAYWRAHPEIGASAVEELLRFEAPTQHTGRLAAEDTELGGKQIRKGDMITVVVAAANRDPLRFADPETLDLQRPDNRHLSFGWATHYCIGSPFARMMGQIALPLLFERLPEMTLVTTNPEWRGMASLRGLSSLRIDFNAEAAMAKRGTRLNVE